MNHGDDRDLDRTLSDLGIGTGEDTFDLDGPALAETDAYGEPVLAGGSVVPDDGDPRDRTEAFLVDLLLEIDPGYAVDVMRVDDDEVYAEIYGGDAGRLIGKNGRTLSALEQIVNAVVNRREGSHVRVNVDVGGYKRRRDERLRTQTENVVARVLKHGEPIEMDFMSAAERRVVHMVVAEFEGVVSESSGEGRERRVVVYPEAP